MYHLASLRKSAPFDQAISFHNADKHLDSHRLRVVSRSLGLPAWTNTGGSNPSDPAGQPEETCRREQV